jgi:hypothetical protein
MECRLTVGAQLVGDKTEEDFHKFAMEKIKHDYPDKSDSIVCNKKEEDGIVVLEYFVKKD